MNDVDACVTAGSIPPGRKPAEHTAVGTICRGVNIGALKCNSRKEIGDEKSFDLNLG
ncbi:MULTISPECIES: hypothetical protein [unclassified Mycobacterium]|uniref:hypothetical protein n=1 Tax=Mycobacterium sp. DL99 TaxID=2528957 RepID=UPI0014368AF9|nr:hypothetical protein [Mycobacterium sp. DL99]